MLKVEVTEKNAITVSDSGILLSDAIQLLCCEKKYMANFYLKSGDSNAVVSIFCDEDLYYIMSSYGNYMFRDINQLVDRLEKLYNNYVNDQI